MLRQEWEQAISLLEKRVEICRRTANSNGLVTGLQKLAAALEGACDYRRAIAVHQELQRLYERAGIYSLRRQSVVSEARDHGRLGNKEHAASLLERVAAEVSSAEVETEASALLEEARTWRQGEDPTGPVIEQNEERVVLRSIGRGEDVGQGLAAMLMVGAERRLEREGKWEELVEMYGGELWEGFRSRNQAWVQAAAQKLDKALRHSPHARLYDVPIKFVELEKGQWAALFRVWDLGMADRQGNRVPENGAVIGDSPVGAYFSAAEYLGNLQDTRDGRPFSMKVDKAETLRTTPIHQVLVAPDEMTAVYDSEGEQLTQYQGWWRDKGPLIMEDAPDGAKFFVASRPIAEQILRTNRAWGVHVR